MTNVTERSKVKTYGNVVNGKTMQAQDGAVTNSIDPSTGKVWAMIPSSKKEDAEMVIQAARGAFADWADLPARTRGDYMRKIGDMIPEYAAELLELETRNNGWVLDEYGYLAEVLKQIWYDAAGAASLVGSQGRTVQMGAGDFGFTARKPYGVAVLILPWNAPLFTFTIKAAYALAAGNTVVIKPSESAAVGSLRYGELISQILPPGVLNVISGAGREIGDYLVGHKEVNKVSLTGSKATAERITKATAHSPKSLIFELGGKSPNIVFEDANIDQAVYGLIHGIFTRNSGQLCVAGSRMLIQRSIYDEVIGRLKDLMTDSEFVKHGDILNTNNTMGPIANESQYKSVCSYIDEASHEGYEIVFGGKYGGNEVLPGQPEFADGYWVQPTLVKVADNSMKLAREEIFGPVAVAIPFDTEEEAVQIANDTNFGLAAGVWTQNLGLAHRMIDKLQAGNVWVNTYARVGADLPFSGMKESGYGTDSILDYTQEKACVINIG
ncbi:aldehyde dehydrogenase [Sporosarcina sp. P37]|uniref:aldehyde dehydrogenase family protein n=1 Tax=unclassified Sporosarcina TaxID=2647733 RepID=UPI0009BDBAD1|nr:MULTISPECIES: aldehyde dehydrogenase family protein [unclassified Sporosarcina]ARD46915.1 aldehyde dehydrogenase [Sporosarcina sp. P33]ARK23441.1 aldehyde dehydrogenase [Sporosarcina sp. P37]PID18651.1 aldehyde dehydrogenase [Sporosarcina sp. P35]